MGPNGESGPNGSIGIRLVGCAHLQAAETFAIRTSTAHFVSVFATTLALVDATALVADWSVTCQCAATDEDANAWS